jgi:hypothetical protein
MNSNKQAFNHKILSDVLARVERYEEGMQQHQTAKKPSKLAIAQYEDLRDEMINFLLDCVVEVGGKRTLVNYVVRMNMPSNDVPIVH